MYRQAKILLIAIACAAIAFMAHAEGVKGQTFSIAHSGTNVVTAAALQTGTAANLRGMLDEIQIDIPGVAGVTGAVSVYITSKVTGDTVELYTNNVATTDVLIRPRFVGHNAAGGAISGVAGERFALFDETITMTVTNVGTRSTNITYKFSVKIEE